MGGTLGADAWLVVDRVNSCDDGGDDTLCGGEDTLGDGAGVMGVCTLGSASGSFNICCSFSSSSNLDWLMCWAFVLWLRTWAGLAAAAMMASAGVTAGFVMCLCLKKTRPDVLDALDSLDHVL